MGTILGLAFVLSVVANLAEIETMPVHMGADPIGSALIVPEHTGEQLFVRTTGAALELPTSSFAQRDATPRQWLDSEKTSELPQALGAWSRPDRVFAAARFGRDETCKK